MVLNTLNNIFNLFVFHQIHSCLCTYIFSTENEEKVYEAAMKLRDNLQEAETAILQREEVDLFFNDSHNLQYLKVNSHI